MPTILALDLATKTGWAHSNGTSGVQDFKPRRGDSPGMRWLEFGAWLDRLYDLAPFEVLAHEQPHYRGGKATEVLAGYVAKCQEWCADHDVEITSRHTSEIKRFATGKGNASKEEMIEAASLVGDVIDDNHADALWLLALIEKELGNGR